MPCETFCRTSCGFPINLPENGVQLFHQIPGVHMPPKKRVLTPAEQSARFREAAKKAEVGDGKAFERAFKTVMESQTSQRPKRRQPRPRGRP